MTDFFVSWLSGASVNSNNVDFYARQLSMHNVEADTLHHLSPEHLISLGFSPDDADQTIRYARECNSVSEEFDRLVRQSTDSLNVIDTVPLLAESTPPITQSKKRAHYGSSNDEFKPPLPLAELAASMRATRSQGSSADMLHATPVASNDPLPPLPFPGLAGFPLSPLQPPMPSSSSPSSSGDSYSAIIVEEPSDPVMSARSAHLYTLRIAGPHVDKVSVFAETEGGEKTSDGVLVENSTAQPGGVNSDVVLLQVRLRFKAQRLQVRRAVFECLVKNRADDIGGVVVVARSAPFIVCSHITSQRQQALERLEAARSRTTVSALQQRILQCYNECGFARLLSERDMVFLRDTAVQTAGTDASATDATLVDTKAFWVWLRKAMKLLLALKPYWESGVIAGFVSRNESVDMLSNQPDGTCVVRFSSSVPKAFAVTCKIGGTISNKMIDKTAAGDWKLFTSSLRSFSGNISAVVDLYGRAIPLEIAFPPIPDADSPPKKANSQSDRGYDETRSVNELVKDLRKATLDE